MLNKTLGNFGERSNDSEYLTLAFSPTNAPLRSRWRNQGLSADFLGDYVTTFLPTKGGLAAVENQQQEIRHAVTYIANELLENAMKYHQRDVDIPTGIHLELTSDHITVRVSNGIGAFQAEHYKANASFIADDWGRRRGFARNHAPEKPHGIELFLRYRSFQDRRGMLLWFANNLSKPGLPVQ